MPRACRGPGTAARGRAASAGTPAARSIIYRGKANFQPHHQPFNYFANFDPQRNQDRRGAHLLDFDARFFADADAGKLPHVTFYKPQGNLNQHAGYANMATATRTSPT